MTHNNPISRNALIQALIGHDYRIDTSGQWAPSAQVYNGDADALKTELERTRYHLTRDEETVIDRQLAEIDAQLEGQRVRFSEIKPKPNEPWLPEAILQSFYREVVYTTVTVTRKEDGLHSSDTDLEQYLTGVGRRRDNQHKYDKWEAEFPLWIISHAQEEQIENIYNDQRNNWLDGAWREDQPQIGGWNDAIKPHKWQSETVQRLQTQPNLIVGLDVGLGKTITAIMHALISFERGRAKRIAVITPKNVLGKWRDEFLMCNPNLRINVIGAKLVKGEWKDDSSGDTLERQLEESFASKPQVVLMSHTTLSRIPVRAQTTVEHFEREHGMKQGDYYRPNNVSHAMFSRYAAAKFELLLKAGTVKLESLYQLNHQLVRIEESIKDLNEGRFFEGRTDSLNSKKAERARLKFIVNGTAQLAKQNHKLGVFFEDLGIDLLIADEAHRYKSLSEPSGRVSAKGLGVSGTSQIATDFCLKIRQVQDLPHSAGTVLLTATPMVNSPIELYSIIHLADPLLMPTTVGISNVDQFLERYALFGEEITFDDDNKKIVKRYLKGLQNLRELRSIASRVIHRRTAKSVGLELPERKGEFVLLKPTDDQNALIRRVGEEPLEAMRDLMGIREIPDVISSERYVKLMGDYRLVINHLLRRIELDLEMVDPVKYKGFISPKVRAWLDTIADDLKNKRRVVAFCDVTNLPNPDAEENEKRVNPHGYNFHEKLRNLICSENNLDPNRVAIINASETPDGEDKLRISKALKAGKIDVIIGNTDSMGEAVDLQWGVGALRHLDVPWNQAKLQQRRGRVERQGNDSSEIIETFHMGIRGFDPFMMDILSIKANWYEQFWDSDTDTIETSDSNIIPSRAMIQALSIDDDTERYNRLQEIKSEVLEERLMLQREAALYTFAQLRMLHRRMQLFELEHGNKRPHERARIEESIERTRAQIDQAHVRSDQLDAPLHWIVNRDQLYGEGEYAIYYDRSDAHVIQLLNLHDDLPLDDRRRIITKCETYQTASIDPFDRSYNMKRLDRHELEKIFEGEINRELLTLHPETRQIAQETFAARAKEHSTNPIPVRRGGVFTVVYGDDVEKDDECVLPGDPEEPRYLEWCKTNSRTPCNMLGFAHPTA